MLSFFLQLFSACFSSSPTVAEWITPVFDLIISPCPLIIGAICAATAPATTLAIIHQYGARGPFSSTLLGVVALDDALTIFIYAFAINITASLIGNSPLTLGKFFIYPSYSIIVSFIIGGGVALALKYITTFITSREIMLGVILGGIFVTSGLAESLHGHALMANMMMGFMMVNYTKHYNDIFAVVENIEEPLFGMFFMLAGIYFGFNMIEGAGLLAVVITLSRFMGKVFGSRVGAHISGAPESVKKFLGIALLPAAGVTVGLVFDAKDYLADVGFSEMMLTGVLGSVLINAFLSPFFLRASLKKVGETQRENDGEKVV